MVALLQRLLLLVATNKKVQKALLCMLLFFVVLLLLGFIVFNGLIISFVYLCRGEELYYPVINTTRIAERYDPKRVIVREYEEVIEKIVYDPKTGKPVIDKTTGLPLTETITEKRTERIESPHMGVDFEVREGSYVVASCGGRVEQTYSSEQDGNTVVVFHEATGYTTKYMHLENILVAQGEELVMGQPVGKVGIIGTCDPPPRPPVDGEAPTEQPEKRHNVHFEVLDAAGEYVDPEPLLHAWGEYRDIAVALITDRAGTDWEDWMESDAPNIEWNGEGFMWPLPGYSATSSSYGWRTLNGVKEFHRGLDIPAPAGTPIYAAAPGVVSTTGHWSYGTCVKVSVSSNMVHIYAHMTARAAGITDGVMVEAGQVIGYVGNTGNSFGNHLHFEVNVNGQPVDPRQFY